MKKKPNNNKKQIKQKPTSTPELPMPLPAGITFIPERNTSSDELKKSVQILTRTLSPEMRKIVEEALGDDGESG